MNSNQLRQFIAIANEENITRASQKLFMSQSALSNTLKLLESELDCQLFDRRSNRLVLNANGIKLFGYAKQVVGLIEVAEQEFRANKNTKEEINIIASSHVYFSAFLQNNISSLLSQYHLKALECSYSDIFDFLDRSSCDAALAPDWPSIHKNLNRFERIFLGTENLRVVLPISHPLSRQDTVSVADLNGEQFISCENDTEFRWQDHLFIAKGCCVEYCIELPRGPSLFNTAISSAFPFPTFVSSLVQTPTGPDRKVVPITDNEATRNIYLWYRPDAREIVDTLIKKML